VNKNKKGRRRENSIKVKSFHITSPHKFALLISSDYTGEIPSGFLTLVRPAVARRCFEVLFRSQRVPRDFGANIANQFVRHSSDIPFPLPMSSLTCEILFRLNDAHNALFTENGFRLNAPVLVVTDMFARNEN